MNNLLAYPWAYGPITSDVALVGIVTVFLAVV